MSSLWLEPPTPQSARLAGLTLGHTHLYASLARAMAIDVGQPDRFEQILERLWWRLDVALDAQTLRAAVEVSLLDALECGVTTVIDHHESPSFIDGSLDVIAEAARRIGVRLVACYGSTDRHGAAAAAAGLRENERFAHATADDGLVFAMVGLHAPFTVSDDTLRAHVELSRSLGIGLHLHAAEAPVDADAGERLRRFDALGRRTLIAHGVHLSDEHYAHLARTGTTIAHNPRSNQQNAVGYGRALRHHQGPVVLGTDGMDGDLFTELRAAHLLGRAAHGPQGQVDAVGWLAAGLELSRLLCGDCHRDAVVLNYDPPTPMHADNAAGHLLFGIGARHVRQVWVDGRLVLDDGVPTRVDAAQLRSDARAQAARLWRKIG